jgi:hypothetical protein
MTCASPVLSATRVSAATKGVFGQTRKIDGAGGGVNRLWTLTLDRAAVPGTSCGVSARRYFFSCPRPPDASSSPMPTPSSSPSRAWSIPKEPAARRCSSSAGLPRAAASSARRRTRRESSACARRCRCRGPFGSARTPWSCPSRPHAPPSIARFARCSTASRPGCRPPASTSGTSTSPAPRRSTTTRRSTTWHTASGMP